MVETVEDGDRPVRYLVTVADGVDPGDVAADLAMQGHHVPFLYHRLRGFAVDLDDPQPLYDDGRIVLVEPDQQGTLENVQDAAAYWQLDRIDQRELPMDGQYRYDFDGDGVRIYVFDTSIRTSHVQLSPRAHYAGDGSGLGFNGQGERSTTSFHNHGTRVAGIAAGTLTGVAKQATVVEMRVASDTGSVSSAEFVNACNWVVANHPSGTPGVVNASLSFGINTTVDSAAASVVAAGVPFVCAAGNQTSDASERSPGRDASTITVSATTAGDARQSTSNFGPPVTLFAPGNNTQSLSHTNDTAEASFGLTSSAAASVAGVCALILQEHPEFTPEQVRTMLLDRATPGVLSNVGTGSPNLLVYTDPAVPLEPGVVEWTVATRDTLGRDGPYAVPFTFTRPVPEPSDDRTGTIGIAEQDDGAASSGTAVAPQAAGTTVWAEQDDGIAAAGELTVVGGPPVPSGITVTVDGTALVFDGYEIVHAPGTAGWSEAGDGITAAGTHEEPSAGGVSATGGTVTEPGDGYRYHTFNTSDDLVVTEGGDVEYLVVAGGGAGGNNSTSTNAHASGGGGAGGAIAGTATLEAGTYPAVIGSGGPSTSSTPSFGPEGSGSSFNNDNADGGGGGGANDTFHVPRAGGSGGGGSGAGTTLVPGASGTTDQGTSGGTGGGGGAAQRSGGGGGGKAAAGGNGATSAGGSGGAGLEWPAGSGTYYAGGGGGAVDTASTPGPGGDGGGGVGGTRVNTNPGDGTPNTGGGGGGGWGNTGGSGAGGSGVVIVRYPL